MMTTILQMLIENWLRILMICLVLYMIRIAFFIGIFTKLKRDLKGKVIIVTGSSAGIGKAMAIQLLEDGAEVIFACRNREKVNKVWKEIEKKNKECLKRAHFIELNLVTFKSVKKFVDEFNDKFLKLDILINNAALYPIKFEITEDRLESNYQQNYFSLVVLTMLLLDKFDKKEGRIINLSSFAHVQCDYSVEVIENLKKDTGFESVRKNYYGNVWLKHYHYANTKTAGIFFTSFLSEYLSKHFPQIKVASTNPGIVYTEFARFMYGHRFLGTLYDCLFFLYIYIAKSPLAGSQTTLHCCYEDFAKLVSGAYYSDCKLGKQSALSKDKHVRDAILKFTFELLRERDQLKEISNIPY